MYYELDMHTAVFSPKPTVDGNATAMRRDVYYKIGLFLPLAA